MWYTSGQSLNYSNSRTRGYGRFNLFNWGWLFKCGWAYATWASKTESIIFGDASTSAVHATGLVKVNDKFELKNVALVEDLKYNLLLVSQIVDENFEVHFKKIMHRDNYYTWTLLVQLECNLLEESDILGFSSWQLRMKLFNTFVVCIFDWILSFLVL
uniref:Uncharacterized protein n=1 Tax=Oryza sativa subsp. japonica TaxID=39947 RepID=Q33AN5_ORYSJ|nr:hypothetical protein LOC_Os10g09050 [Oryza sativa Japonica Group]